MKLSTKGRYATRAMLDLAINYDKDDVVLLKDIAKRQDVSPGYLERIMATLVSAGLVNSSRGQNGGFRLAKPPKEITLDQIIQTAEGSLAPVACVDDPKQCERVDICITRDIWKKLKDAMLNVLQEINLEGMVEMYKKKVPPDDDGMYHI